MGLSWFRQREEMDTDDRGKRSLAARQNQATKVTANDSQFKVAANA